MSLYLGENLISGQATLVGESRNIGQIIPSTIPLTDAGLHLLDGSLIQGSGIYSAFVDYIASLDLTANYFCTESEWQQSVNTYGVCGKFVYDSTNNTVRLPKVTGIIEGTTDVTALGDLVEAGLPNITGRVGFASGARGGTYSGTGAFTVEDASESYAGYPSGNGRKLNAINFDASISDSIYGNSTTVQPQTIKAFYYIVIATSTKTDIEVDIDEIATDLNGKADVDLTNCTKPHIVETYVNGSSWYRVYSDGWCEQGGIYTSSVGNNVKITVNLLKQYMNTNYNICIALNRSSEGSNGVPVIYGNPTTTTFVYMNDGDYDELGFRWQVCGYIN